MVQSDVYYCRNGNECFRGYGITISVDTIPNFEVVDSLPKNKLLDECESSSPCYLPQIGPKLVLNKYVRLETHGILGYSGKQ
mmetsp:Transcript_175/g.230  ORF Transcript_175/g.230 Transcript_175/m.230 type:complete len:82 (-) Transcript_175:1388-1633(-)